MRVRVAMLVACLAVGALFWSACAYDWTFYGANGAGDGGSAEGGEGGTGSDGSGGTDSPGPVPPPPPPGFCTPSNPCPATQWCDYPAYDCGKVTLGKCSGPVPCPAPAKIDYVCGCDSTVYKSVCEANQKLTDLADDGRCKGFDATALFPCGYRFCLRGTEYCERDKPLDGGPVESTCLAFPACAQRDCSCFAKCSCSGNADAGLTLVCP